MDQPLWVGIDCARSYYTSNQINLVHCASLQAVLARYPGVFRKGLRNLKAFKAKIQYVDPDAPPLFTPLALSPLP